MRSHHFEPAATQKAPWGRPLHALLIAALLTISGCSSSDTTTAPTPIQGGSSQTASPAPAPTPTSPDVPVNTGTTDSSGSAVVAVPGGGSASVQVTDQEGHAIERAVVVASNNAIAVGAAGFVPVISLGGASTLAPTGLRALSIGSAAIKLRKAVCGSESAADIAADCTGSSLMGIVSDVVGKACSITDPLENGAFFCTSGSSLLQGNVIASTLALNAGNALSSLWNQLRDRAPDSVNCGLDIVGFDPTVNLQNAYVQLTTRNNPGLVMDYVALNVAGTAVFTPFACPVPTAPTATGEVQGSAWSGTLRWTVQNKLLTEEHARVWSNSSCSGSAAYDFIADVTDPLREFGKLSLSGASAPVSRSVTVAIPAGTYSWMVETTQLDRSTRKTSCMPLNAGAASSSASPVISDITPTSASVGTFTMTVTGEAFNPAAAQLVITGPNCPTTSSCVVPNGVLTAKTATRLTGPVTLTNPGTFTIQVRNGDTGSLSNSRTVTVAAPSSPSSPTPPSPAPAPSIGSLSPGSVTVGSFTLTIAGSGFDPSAAQIVITGPGCATTTTCVVPNGVLTTRSATQLAGPITLANVGTFTVQVQNGPGGLLSNGRTITAGETTGGPTPGPATPSISGVSPTVVTVGSFSLTISGSNFDPANAQIVVTGPGCAADTCVVPTNVLTTRSATQLAGPVTLANPGTFSIQVRNGSNGSLSNGRTVTANASVPSIDSLSPTTVITGTFSLAINGNNFDPASAQIVVTGPGCATDTACVVPANVLTTRSATQLAGPVTLANPGTFTIQVRNGSSGSLSNGRTVTAIAGAPSISSISPTSVTAGAFSLTINGSNFNVASAQIVVTGPGCASDTACVVPNNVLTTRTAGQVVGPVTLANPGTFTIRIQNGPGGFFSGGATIVVR